MSSKKPKGLLKYPFKVICLREVQKYLTYGFISRYHYSYGYKTLPIPTMIEVKVFKLILTFHRLRTAVNNAS